MGNKTECTGFLARATIKPETKAGLDKTESIMVRRPSLKWNFHAGARTSMKVDLLRPARLFVFHFLFPLESTHFVTYGISNLSRRREFFMCLGRSEVRLASPPWKLANQKGAFLENGSSINRIPVRICSALG